MVVPMLLVVRGLLQPKVTHNQHNNSEFKNLEFVVLVFLSINLSSVGNSAVQAISLIIRKGVPESNIIFLNLISVSQ